MLTTAQQQGVATIVKLAIQCEHATGVPKELTAAQAIFESNYLTIAPGNNCFGIKADAHGAGVRYTLTHEFLNGQWKEMKLAFEVYNSIYDCFVDHARLIQGGVYQAAWSQYLEDKDLDAYIRGVAKHYATDPTYAEKMVAEAHSGTVQTALTASLAAMA